MQFGFFSTFAIPLCPLSQELCEIFMFFFLFHVGRSGTSPDLVCALSSQLSLAFSGSRIVGILLVVPILCNLFLPVKEGGSEVPKSQDTGAWPNFTSSRFTVLSVYLSACSSLVLIEALPSYETGGSVAFVCNGASSQKPCCTMGVLVVLRRATFTLFYPLPVVAIRPLLSVYSIRGAIREHRSLGFNPSRCELGNSTLMPCGL